MCGRFSARRCGRAAAAGAGHLVRAACRERAQLVGQIGAAGQSVLLVEDVGQCIASADASGAVELVRCGVEAGCRIGAAGAAAAASRR